MDKPFPFARWLPLLAVLLTLPALATGLQFDDYAQRELLLAHRGLAGLEPATATLFTFLDGDPARALARMERGELAWWTLPQARIAFWRPLSGLTHWLDYQLWPGSPALMHLHSLAWLAALAAAATGLFHRLMGRAWAATLAAALYALDDARGFGAAWLANRNALCAALFAVLAVRAHMAWREGGGARQGWLALLWLALGLLSGESAVAALAYLAAYALWLEDGSGPVRALSLVPALLLVLLWRLLYGAFGYGAWGTSYVDPGAEPLRFAQAVVWRAPLLLFGQWSPMPAEIAPFLAPPAATLLWLAAVALLGGLSWAFAPLLRDDRVARFWGTGMLLASVPPCAALPANRLLFLVGLGAAGLLARFLEQQRGLRQPAQPASSARKVCARALLVVHLGLAPLLLPLAAYSPALLGGAEQALATLPGGPAVGGSELVVVAAPSAYVLAPLAAVRRAEGRPAPGRAFVLAAALGEVRVARLDRFTLVVRPAEGYLLGFESTFRAPWYGLAVGEQVHLGQMSADVVDITVDGRPAAVAFRFATPLEAPGRLWFTWADGGYVPIVLPAVGEELRLRWSP